MGRHWPAIDVQGSPDPGLIVAAADEFSPTAVDGQPDSVRLFFATTSDRDAACAMLAERYVVRPIDVDDEDWARRSQQNLAPVTVGRITVLPNPKSRIPNLAPPNPESPIPNPNTIQLVIQPSMGFGTGHHADDPAVSRRASDHRSDRRGSCSMSAPARARSPSRRFASARRVRSASTAADAIESARENLALNPDVGDVAFEVADLTSTVLPAADIVTANLTGALLIRAARRRGPSRWDAHPGRPPDPRARASPWCVRGNGGILGMQRRWLDRSCVAIAALSGQSLQAIAASD